MTIDAIGQEIERLRAEIANMVSPDKKIKACWRDIRDKVRREELSLSPRIRRALALHVGSRARM